MKVYPLENWHIEYKIGITEANGLVMIDVYIQLRDLDTCYINDIDSYLYLF